MALTTPQKTPHQIDVAKSNLLSRLADRTGQLLRNILSHHSGRRPVTLLSFDKAQIPHSLQYCIRAKTLSLLKTDCSPHTTIWSFPEVKSGIKVAASESGNYVAILEQKNSGQGCRVLDADNGAVYKEFSLELPDVQHIRMPDDQFIEVLYKPDNGLPSRSTYYIDSGKQVENVQRADPRTKQQ